MPKYTRGFMGAGGAGRTVSLLHTTGCSGSRARMAPPHVASTGTGPAAVTGLSRCIASFNLAFPSRPYWHIEKVEVQSRVSCIEPMPPHAINVPTFPFAHVVFDL